ncbi:MAG: hypothetical protein QME79_12855 [Bacillota bacterium]|nr:hypothetical protein [Bacillota bacterium]
MASPLEFPLCERAERLGLFDGWSALVVAPTATGKSHIGRTAIRRALERGEPGPHVYLVPFRALAEEIYQSFLEELAATGWRVRISTGDHRDALRSERVTCWLPPMRVSTLSCAGASSNPGWWWRTSSIFWRTRRADQGWKGSWPA